MVEGSMQLGSLNHVIVVLQSVCQERKHETESVTGAAIIVDRLYDRD